MNEIITFTIKHGVIKMVKSVTQYFTEDGTAFDTYEEANTYEKKCTWLSCTQCSRVVQRL